MTLIEWDPFRNIEALQERINRMFDDSFPGVGRKSDNIDSKGEWKPATDIYETEDAVVITAELPGVAKEDVSIEVKGVNLTISGKRREDKTVAPKNYYRRERNFGAFSRTFALQDPPNPDKIKASFKEGVLSVSIPKPQEEIPKQITVEVD